MGVGLNMYNTTGKEEEGPSTKWTVFTSEKKKVV